LLAHEPHNFGFREEKVVVGNADVADWKNVKQKLKDLLIWLNDATKTWYPPELAFTFYYRFERIHPFLDGNGRIGRLIMNKILNDHRYPSMIIWDNRRNAHMSAFASFINGRGQKYFKFMTEQFIQTYELYLEKIRKSLDFKCQLNCFLKSSK